MLTIVIVLHILRVFYVDTSFSPEYFYVIVRYEDFYLKSYFSFLRLLKNNGFAVTAFANEDDAVYKKPR